MGVAVWDAGCSDDSHGILRHEEKAVAFRDGPFMALACDTLDPESLLGLGPAIQFARFDQRAGLAETTLQVTGRLPG